VIDYDLPLVRLREYRADTAEQADFDEFWSTTLAEAGTFPLDARFEEVETGLVGVRVFDVTFAGFGGHPVKGWFTVPATATPDAPLPLVMQYHGYNGGRSLAHCWSLWPSAGYAHFIMDTRGQGSGGNVGDTADPVGAGPAIPGFMTRGILDPADYYYRRVFTDAVRAVQAVRSHPLVDPARVAALGGSQGGGITLAVAALAPDIAAIAPDVPFLCHFDRAVLVSGVNPYKEIADYLRMHRDHHDQVFRTLSYFDGVHMAARGTAPALFSVALQDEVCPPSTVFAAYNNYRGEKEIAVYPFNGHEGGQMFQEARALRWLPKQVSR